MAKDKQKLKHRKAKAAHDDKAHPPASHAKHKQNSHKQPSQLSTSPAGNVDAAPRSIEDVARLFIGDGTAVEELVKANSTTAQQHSSGAKRPREPSSDGTASSLSKKKAKGNVAARQSNATFSQIAHSTAIKKDPPTAKGKKTKPLHGKVTASKKDEVDNGEEEDEDVALSRAVQAQTLSFLQHLNPQKSKTFWGLRDVAQGKKVKPEQGPTTSGAITGPTKAAAAAGAKIKNKKGKKNRALADDGEELWRVGGPYIPSDADSEEENVHDTRHSKRPQQRSGAKADRNAGDDESDALSHSSATSSEPSWVTDSSDDENAGGDDSSNDFSESDEAEQESDSDDGDRGRGKAVKTDKKASHGLPKGGGRLFQSGDDVWDDDDD